jgi:tRNA(Arg) A34 adenosine deaminase TadA
MTKALLKHIKQELITRAENNQEGNPFSACIYHKPTGLFWFTTNKVKYDVTAHAEIEALRYHSTLIGMLLFEDCILISSGEPCPMCITAIAWSGIKEVYYIDDYKIANKKGFKFDRDCHKTNKYLKLGLTIRKV